MFCYFNLQMNNCLCLRNVRFIDNYSGNFKSNDPNNFNIKIIRF